MRNLKAVLLVALVPLFAQEPQPTSGGEVFRVSSTLVQVDAVVTDSKGNQVTNLNRDDFELSADGVPQKITRFSYIAISPPATAAPQPKASVKDPLSEAPPVISLRREEVRRTMVLMVDDLNLSFESMAFVRSSLLKFVDEQMEPGDLVAVCRTSAGSSAMQQFTADRRRAHAAVNSLPWNPRSSFGVSFYEPVSLVTQPEGPPTLATVDNADPAKEESRKMSQQLDRLRQSTLAEGALGAVDYVIQALHDMPGRKSVVLFSDALFLDPSNEFTLDALHRLVDRANRSGTVIYTMHATGLVTGFPMAADSPNLTQDIRGNALTAADRQALLNNISTGRADQLFKAQSGLEYLATLTGGLAYFNGNSLNYGLERVLEDQKGYYLLGYSPSSDTFNPKKSELPYHKLKVAVKDAHLHVRSRTGFFGATDEATKPHFANADDELRAAMLSPFASSSVGIRLTPIYSEVPGKGPVVRSLLDIDAHDLTFQAAADGSYQTKLKLVAAAYGSDNKPISTFGYDYTVTVPAAKMDAVRSEGALYEFSIPLPKPGGFHIRVAVRDEASKKTGSATAFIDVPNTRRKQLALTSLILAAANKTGTEGSALSVSAAKRQFHRGDTLEYFSLLENGDPKHIADSDMTVQIRVVNDGKEVYLGSARLVDLPDNKRVANGSFRLGEKLQAGDYFVQIVASSPKGRKNATAEQWSDFEILP